TPYPRQVLIDPKKQRLILLVSDCISVAWRRQLIHPVLKLWGRNGLLTILQLLPERLWERTALASEIPVQLHSFSPGVVNSQFIVKPWDEDDSKSIQKKSSVNVPVVTLEHYPLLAWSQVIAGHGNVTTVGFNFDVSQDPQVERRAVDGKPNQTQLKAPALVSRFRATASPMARRLAGLMAAAPVSLPVVQLIQQTLLPKSTQIHVAEVFMSGLLQSITPVDQDSNPNYIEYEFKPGVKELLVDSVPISKTLSVLDTVSEFIAKKLGLSVQDFEARLLKPATASNDGLEEKIRPFAHLKAQVLGRLGGEYARLAEQLLISETPRSDHREVIFSWLHLTDLHLGMDGLGDLWPNIEEIFFEDLEYLCEKVGPFDLVMFTGDITQRGSQSEFQQVDELLTNFWNKFREMGFEPKFLAVPGNHDLVRPDNKFDTALICLEDMWDNPKIQKPFWDNIESPSRQLVIKAFENYVQWWENTTVPKPDIYSEGILPGDFSATIEKNGFRLGILGLNSAFLQLMGGDRQGKLALDMRQFHGACHKNGPSWAKDHHACLLLTHHPQHWLTDEAQAQLIGEIHSPPERFALHLFGHMHGANLRTLAEGGANARRRLQGCSLFGMEGWGEKNNERVHGYSLCELKIEGNTASLSIYPRKAEKKQGRGWEIDRDISFRLPKGEEGTEPVAVKLLRKGVKNSIGSEKKIKSPQ
ncbi:SAV_2336 N-terminal domain-related protein, partial [Moorena sp. SIO3I6]|uniref:SAV_2336 N-terminal domain-related protein n=1 Tax=Moorena sp. SIO3I6 TaxID=2607831 RepID=UPI0013FAD09A